jgi:hypothetical protein
MKDCEAMSAEAPIRQGDVFMWGNVEDRNPWDRLGVVMTADCDIALNKTGDFYTYLPLITYDCYLHDVWADRKLRALARKKLPQCRDLIHKLHSKLDPDALPLELEVLVEWLKRSSIEEIQEALGHPTGSDARELAACCELLKCCYPVESEEATVDPLERLIAAQTVNGRCDKAKAKATLRKDCQSEFHSAPQDVFFICELPGLPTLGYVVMLRHIRALGVGAISASYGEARGQSNVAFRLGRLRPELKYALTHRFGVLFSRVGLSAEYEDHQRSIFEEATDTLLSGS